MNKEEIFEWCGLKSADFLCYLGVGLVVVMWYATENLILDITLAIVATVLLVISCIKGMKPSSRLSNFTNAVKKISYPLILIIALVFIAGDLVR